MFYNERSDKWTRLFLRMVGSLVFLLSFHSTMLFAQAANGNFLLHAADSLFKAEQWKPAMEKYRLGLSDTVTNPVSWNRFGYCNYQLGLYKPSISHYEKALTLNPPPAVKMVIELRLARSYARLKDEKESLQWLDKAVQSGYSDLSEIGQLKDFDAYRHSSSFEKIYQRIYNSAYPCAVEAKQREFDFWIGEWDVFQNGTTQLVGHSIVQKISGECALLENWTASRGGGVGKSINYVDPQTNHWEQDWIGSMGGPQRYINGVYKDSAMRFTYESSSNGQKVTGNFIFYYMGPDKVRQYQDASTDGGKTFTVSYDFIYIRKKSKSN